MTPEEQAFAFAVRVFTKRRDWLEEGRSVVESALPADALADLAQHAVTAPPEWGEAESHDHNLRIAEALTAAGRPLPVPLAEYLLKVAREGPPGQGRGPPRRVYEARDDLIVQVIFVIECDWGIKPSRNETADSECGFSIVSRALTEVDAGLSERTVKGIWNRRGVAWRREPRRPDMDN